MEKTIELSRLSSVNAELQPFERWGFDFRHDSQQLTLVKVVPGTALSNAGIQPNAWAIIAINDVKIKHLNSSGLEDFLEQSTSLRLTLRQTREEPPLSKPLNARRAAKSNRRVLPTPPAKVSPPFIAWMESHQPSHLSYLIFLLSRFRKPNRA